VPPQEESRYIVDREDEHNALVNASGIVVLHRQPRDCGQCFIRIYGPDLDQLTQAAGDTTAGWHVTYYDWIPAEIDENDEPVGTYTAVLFTLETEEQGAGDRGPEQKWHKQKGTTSLERLGVDLEADQGLFGGTTEETEEDPGAYVHYNVDNDNLNTNGGGQSIPDYTEDGGAGGLTGENDLCKAILSHQPSDLTDVKVVLRRVGSGPRVWKSATKGTGNEVLTDQQEIVWDLRVPAERAEYYSIRENLWVEGYAEGEFQLIGELRRPDDVTLVSDPVKYTFIAAICAPPPAGQPTPAERVEVQGVLPRIVHCEWCLELRWAPAYNCISWSVGETDVFYHSTPGQGSLCNEGSRIIIDCDNPNQNHPWEHDGDGQLEQSEIVSFYDHKGFDRLTGAEATPENGDAMYYTLFHAARRQTCNCGRGKWVMFSSKCGQAARIEHVYDQFDGGMYGDHDLYFKRR